MKMQKNCLVLLLCSFLLVSCAGNDRGDRDYRFGYGKNIFTDNGLFVPSTYQTFKDTDFRVERYCKGFKKAAYYGKSETFGHPIGIFVTRVVPLEGERCTVYGFFSKLASDYPLQVYPFRSEFNGTESVTSTNNFHGIGSVDRVFHTMRIDGYRLIYKGFPYSTTDRQEPLIKAVLYEVKDLKSYVPAVEVQLEREVVDGI
jgi:hypothetical protein